MGEAIDAALANPQFDTWLAEQPESTWSAVNIALEEQALISQDWELRVFRGQGVSWSRGSAFIDPVTGKVFLDLCPAPCSR
jgi:hypothetical protein